LASDIQNRISHLHQSQFGPIGFFGGCQGPDRAVEMVEIEWIQLYLMPKLFIPCQNNLIGHKLKSDFNRHARQLEVKKHLTNDQ
jgi:hypothetical protein